MADTFPAVEYSGPISIPVRKLVELVALSATFAARIGGDDTGDPYARIFHPCVKTDSDFDALRGPVAVISTDSFRLRRHTSNYLARDACALELLLRDDARYIDGRPGDRYDWSQTDFEGFIGGVVDDVAAAQGVDDALPIESIELVHPPMLNQPKAAAARPPYWMAIFTVQLWSPRG